QETRERSSSTRAVHEVAHRTSATSSPQLSSAMELLLNGLNQRRPHTLVANFRGVPAAAQSLHQENGSGHLLTEQLRYQALVTQKCGLCGNHIEVCGDAADVAIVGDVE